MRWILCVGLFLSVLVVSWFGYKEHLACANSNWTNDKSLVVMPIEKTEANGYVHEACPSGYDRIDLVYPDFERNPEWPFPYDEALCFQNGFIKQRQTEIRSTWTREEVGRHPYVRFYWLERHRQGFSEGDAE